MKLTPAQRIALAYQTEQKYGLPKGMLVAQLNQESSNGKNDYNASSGATGAMQFMPSTAASYGIDPNDDTQAIDGAGRYMAKNLKDAGGNVSQALKLYYAGSPKGIGPKTEAYVGQVASKWNPDDAFEAAMNGNKQPVADTAPTPATPANSQPDYEGSFDKAMGGGTPVAAQAPEDEQPAEDPALVNLKAGMQHIAELTKDPAKVREFVQASGYDPDTMANLDVNVKTGSLTFSPNFDETTKPVVHTTSNDLLAGIQRGAHDVGGTLQSLAAYEDQQHPFLAKIDNFAHDTFGMPSAQGYQDLSNANILTRKAYDQNYGSVASGTGRLGAQMALTAPFVGGVGSIAAKAAPEVAAPALDFVSGRGGTNLITKGLSAATAGSAIGATSNALTASAGDQPLGQRVQEGAEGGAILGPAARVAGGAVQSLTSRVAPGVDAATAKLVQLAHDKYGITLDGDQITNSPLVRKVSAMMDLNPVNNHLARDVQQRGQFTQAVGRTFGADSPTLTPEVMSAAKDKIGSTLDAIAARNPVHVDDELLTDLGDIEHRYSSSVTDQEMAPIKRNLDNILSAAKDGDTITGETYQRLTSKGSPLDIATQSSNPSIRQAALEIRGSLDDALERSANASGNAADIQALRAARLQYKNLKTVEPLVSKSADGQISPALLNNRVSVNFKNRAYQGAGDLGELADIGKRFLTPPSTSGTPEGIRAQRLLEGAGTGAAIAAAATGHVLGYPGAGDIAGLSLFAGRRAAGAGTNAILRRLMESQAYKNRLLGSALNADLPPAPNFLPVFTNVGANRILQQTYFSPPPQPQNP